MISSLFKPGLSPHGICLLWQPSLLWLHARIGHCDGVCVFRNSHRISVAGAQAPGVVVWLDVLAVRAIHPCMWYNPLHGRLGPLASGLWRPGVGQGVHGDRLYPDGDLVVGHPAETALAANTGTLQAGFGSAIR